VTPAELSAAVLAAVTAVVDAGELAVAVPSGATIERPKQREHGDYATNMALVLAKPAGRPPREVAELLAARLRELPDIAAVDIAGPGFLNIRLAQGSAAGLAGVIVAAGTSYGTGTVLQGTSVNMEFISANPTGPLHLGHTRWAAVGDAIARVLEAAGASVTREFYINDRGVQMDNFGASLMASANGRPVPKDGYHGEYVADLAKQVVANVPGILDLPEADQLVAFREEGYVLQLEEQRRVLDDFRTHFDVWFSERTLYESGAVERGLDKLRSQGHVFEQDGAVWLRTTDFGDDKDRVLVKSDGELTYFTADTAYYVDKRVRGFDVCIYLLGADHHGYVNRLRAVAMCAGDTDANISVLIGQLVKIVKNGEEVRLSKRAGNIVTLEEFVEMAGVDAVRYTLCRYPTDSPLTLDIGLITQQTSENPVFYVQYAHARIASLLRNAVELGVDKGDAYDASLLGHERENDLLLALAQYPGVVAASAELREPHRVARYLEELAGTYHRFYDACRVLPMGDEPANDLHRARLWLMDATRTVLSNGLGLLGVSAPERM
jgi:arginyl-tRNA synthetase